MILPENRCHRVPVWQRGGGPMAIWAMPKWTAIFFRWGFPNKSSIFQPFQTTCGESDLAYWWWSPLSSSWVTTAIRGAGIKIPHKWDSGGHSLLGWWVLRGWGRQYFRELKTVRDSQSEPSNFLEYSIPPLSSSVTKITPRVPFDSC